jgi:hypothetical protein
MRILVPHSREYPLTMLVILTPTQQISVKLDASHQFYDFDVPDGFTEDHIAVYSAFLGANQRQAYGCGPVLLKAAKIEESDVQKESEAEAVEAGADAGTDAGTDAGAETPVSDAVDTDSTDAPAASVPEQATADASAEPAESTADSADADTNSTAAPTSDSPEIRVLDVKRKRRAWSAD